MQTKIIKDFILDVKKQQQKQQINMKQNRSN